jgi:hypothetical protein
VSDDPFAALGVGPEATLAELSAARRRLAQRVHPDHGGDAAAMTALNAAYDAAVRHLEARSAETSPPSPPPASTPSAPAPAPRQREVRRVRGVQYDSPSFTIDVLPVDAFEALLVATSWIGEVLVDDPPYVLEVALQEPSPCWCRLDLVPDAGATTVSLTVAAFDGVPAPDVEDVRDVWVTNLNALGDV